MGRYTFWILLGACLLAAGAVYFLEVARPSGELETQAAVLDSMSERADSLGERAIGPATVATMKNRLAAADELTANLEAHFATIDSNNVERWFPGLRLGWSEQPLREEFKRFYNLATDQLVREASKDLEGFGYDDPSLPLIEHPWMRGSDLPPNDRMRGLQQEFWVQDRLVRAFSRVGAVLTRPVRGGERQAAVGASAGGRFDRVRYDVQVRCKTLHLRRVLHALDRPFEVRFAGGASETMFLGLVVDNVSVRSISVDTATANRYADEPPVEVSFFVTLLDFQNEPKAGS